MRTQADLSSVSEAITTAAEELRSRDGQIVARVAPAELEAADPLAGLGGRQNQIVLDTDLLGPIGIQQLDGGLVHTAYALLSDLVALARSLGRTDASA